MYSSSAISLVALVLILFEQMTDGDYSIWSQSRLDGSRDVEVSFLIVNL